MTFTPLSDDSILAGGAVAGQGAYSVTYTTSLSAVTGIRLEALADPSLPFGSPGFFPLNGNFVLTEITLDATTAPIPEPETYAMLLAGLGLLGWQARRRKLKLAS